MEKSFERWKRQELEETFGIIRQRKHPLLLTLLQATYPCNEAELAEIQLLSEELLQNVESWNEDELKFNFIAPFMRLVRFNSLEGAHIFTQRRLRAKINNVELFGIVDFMIATGYQIPRQPFFFLHEYKQETKHDNDPSGQLFSEMLAAHELNTEKYPLYGCYIVGRYWYFVVYDGQYYDISKSYDATQLEDLLDIFAFLQFAKQDIIKALQSKKQV